MAYRVWDLEAGTVPSGSLAMAMAIGPVSIPNIHSVLYMVERLFNKEWI